MAKTQSHITNRHILFLLAGAVLFSYAGPNLLDIKPPRLTPKELLSPLQRKEIEAKGLRAEIDKLEDRVALLSARAKLSDKAQELASEKSREAQTAFDKAQEEARLANKAFDEADLKDEEAKQALRYARMTEQQALSALQIATDKEQAAQLALSKAEILQQEANKALKNAQTQARLASQTLAEIEALEAKIAELNADITPPKKTVEEAGEQETASETSDDVKTRRLPDAGKVIVAFDDKLVPDHNIISLPTNLDELEVAERKERFVTLLLPLIIKANEVISSRREEIMTAIETGDRAVIERMAKLYGLSKLIDSDTAADEQALHNQLLLRVAPVPNSLALAQAAVESGWGQSRFAKEGNALFGQWAWTADAGIKPLNASNDRAVIRSFTTIYDSVFAYMHNLNTHRAYQDFREARYDSVVKETVPNGLTLARYLTAYAELGQKYVYTLQAMILHNRFDIYDTYRLAR